MSGGDSSAQRVAPGADEDEPDSEGRDGQQATPAAPMVPPVITTPPGSAAVEQTTYSPKLGAVLVASFDQQGTFAPDGLFRWMASPAIDRLRNIGIGYSFGGPPHSAGQRFAGRLANDPLNTLTLRETVLVEGEEIQTVMRWQDYTQTAIDPSDDCAIWYVGDYIKKGAVSYSSKIGAFRMSGCR